MKNPFAVQYQKDIVQRRGFYMFLLNSFTLYRALPIINTVIECVGRLSTIEQAIDIAGNKAVVMMFGLTKPDETIFVKPFRIFQKELVLKASYINPYTQKRALDLIDSGRLDVSSMVYEVCGLDKLADVLGKPQMRANGKYIISPEK